MTPPLPFSAFHICFSLFGLSAAFTLAWLCRRLPQAYRVRLLFFLGILLALSECYKQMFLYYIVNGRKYDWWYFPFQLCSIPMYLCLILPFAAKFGRKWERLLCTFMYCYNLPEVSSFFAAPYGMMHPYWSLTIHSFYVAYFTRFYRTINRIFRYGLLYHGRDLPAPPGLFLACCGIATAVNILADPYGYPDMFYITPYYPTTQPFFQRLLNNLGLWPEI